MYYDAIRQPIPIEWMRPTRGEMDQLLAAIQSHGRRMDDVDREAIRLRTGVRDLRRRVDRVEAMIDLVIAYVYRAPDRPHALRPEDV
jgi:hypothetical protein